MKSLMICTLLASLAASAAVAAPANQNRPKPVMQPTAAANITPYTVVIGQQIVGADPDANVRLALIRQYEACGIGNCD